MIAIHSIPLIVTTERISRVPSADPARSFPIAAAKKISFFA
jgi:hypothetical protein